MALKHENKKLAITTVCYNDRKSLSKVVASFVKNTTNTPITWFMALQNCSDEFVKNITTLFSGLSHITLVILRFKRNIGLSAAMSHLIRMTVEFEYVLNIEDDWILLDTHVTSQQWLNDCVAFLDANKNITSVFLRAYVGEKDKAQYGWTRTIPYVIHQFKDNFNYEAAMQKETKIDNVVSLDQKTTNKFQFIPNFLFTFNPCLVRNADYHKHVYPLPIFPHDQKIVFAQPSQWGFCEGLTMERTRKAGLICYWFNNGIFGHNEDFFPLE